MEFQVEFRLLRGFSLCLSSTRVVHLGLGSFVIEKWPGPEMEEEEQQKDYVSHVDGNREDLTTTETKTLIPDHSTKWAVQETDTDLSQSLSWAVSPLSTLPLEPFLVQKLLILPKVT